MHRSGLPYETVILAARSMEPSPPTVMMASHHGMRSSKGSTSMSGTSAKTDRSSSWQAYSAPYFRSQSQMSFVIFPPVSRVRFGSSAIFTLGVPLV